MQEVFENIIEKLEEAKSNVPVNRLLDDIIKENPKELGQLIAYDKAIKIVKQEAEKCKSIYIDGEYCWQSCWCTDRCGECNRLCNGDIDYYESYDARNNGWIPVEEELPKDGDNRYYMCIVENHEEDPPMYCQYDEECGFGFYKDIYDEHTLGFVDCEFNTNEELGYEKVIAWQQLLPYQPKGE